MLFFGMTILTFLTILTRFGQYGQFGHVIFYSFLDHFGQFLTTENVRRTFKTLVIPYIFLNHSLVITLTVT